MASARTVPGPFMARPRAGRIFDAAMALAAGASATATVLPHRGATGGLGLAIPLVALASLPLLAWRRAPVMVFLACLLGSALLMALGYPGGPPVGATIALFLVATSRDEARPWTRRLLGLVALVFTLHFAAFMLGHGGRPPLVDVGVGALVWALALFAGDRTRLRRLERMQLEQRALQAERDAERERRLALAEERARIARDLHDSAAHAVNVIAVQAGAARLHLSGDPARSARALETIEEVARRTVAEIDQIVHGLREPAGSAGAVEPPPGLAALDDLLEQHRSAGLEVEVSRRGTARPLAPAVDLSAYRILQEALTNSARHGAGGAGGVRVDVMFGPRALELDIVNPAAQALASRPNGGHGLVGMRERAATVGGEVQAERRNGSFRVHALLPYGAGA